MEQISQHTADHHQLASTQKLIPHFWMCFVATSYVLGHEAMKKMGTSNILIVGLKGLGIEIGKHNKCLPFFCRPDNLAVSRYSLTNDESVWRQRVANDSLEGFYLLDTTM